MQKEPHFGDQILSKIYIFYNEIKSSTMKILKANKTK